jgi:LacI family transcriptional regulator
MENNVKDKRLVVAVVPVNSAVERAVLRGVAVAAARFGWTLETIDPSLPGIDFALFAQLLSQADGVVVRLRESWEKVRPMLRPDAPVVGIDIPPQSSSGLWATVNPENVKIGAMAADELLAAHLRCYAFVPALPMVPWGDARGKGFLDRVRAAGGDARRYEPHSVWTCAAELGELSRWLAQLPRPFGLFARNDLLAKFALGACKSAGIDVPGEASIIGADDDESICLYSTPTLSSVRIDHEGGGRRAAEALRGFFGKTQPQRAAALRFGPYGIAHRASTGAIAHGSDLRLSAGLNFIASHADNPLLGVQDVAVAMGTCRRQAERLFTSTGMTIRQHIEQTRLSRVKELLSTTEMTLGQIASECGFSSQIYLSGLFRKRLGIPPGEWRKQQKSAN